MSYSPNSNNVATNTGSTVVGDTNTYAHFSPTAATVKGALSGIDSALVTAGNGITALTGDVLATGPGSAIALISDNAVSFAKMQDINSGFLLGRSSAGVGNIETITVGSGLMLSGGVLVSTGGSGSVTNVSVTTANGVSGSVSNPTTTPAITLILGAITPSSVAASGSVTGSNLSGTNSGDVTLNAVGSSPNANAASLSGQSLTLQPANASFPGVLLASDWNTFNNKGSGSVTSASVVTANGFAGTVASASTTPAITLSTTITGLLKGDGTAISAAISGTDYQAAGNYITALTGDVVASGPGSAAATIANNAVTFAKMQNIGTDLLLGRSSAGTGNIETISVGSGLSLSGGTLTATGSGGTVTSVALADGSATPIYSITNSPVTTAGTLTFTLNSQNANYIFGGPASGGSAQPGFRLLVVSDIPSLSSLYLPLSGGTMSGNIAMGGNKLTGLGAGTGAGDSIRYEQAVLVNGANSFTANQSMGGNKLTNVANGSASSDAVNYGQLTSLSTGLIWQGPINDPDLVNDQLATPPGSPLYSILYIIGSSPTGAWSGFAGFAAWWDGSNWIDLSTGNPLTGGQGTAVQVGARFLIASATPGGPALVGGSFTNSNVGQIATVLTNTPGSFTWSFATPLNNWAVSDQDIGSQHFNNSFTYVTNGPYTFTVSSANATAGATYTNNGNTFTVQSTIISGTSLLVTGTGAPTTSGTLTKSGGTGDATITFSSYTGSNWIDFAGPSKNQAGNALAYTGNTLNVLDDNSTIGVNGSNQLFVKNGGISNTQINASAAIAYSKLNLSASIVNADIASGAAIAYSKLNLSGSVLGSDLATNTVNFSNVQQIATTSLLGRSSAGTGNIEVLSVGSGLSLSGGTLTATGSGGTVTSVSVVTANGLAGTVATATTTPAITLSTTITGLLKGNGTAISAAVSGTDYQAAGNYITALTSDVSASGPGSAAATVNSVGGSSAANIHSAELAANAATSSATASTIIKRDSNSRAQVADPASASDIATKNYVDNATAGLNPAVAVQAATTSASDTSSFTYNNGVSGVGATFTGPNNTTLTVDGFTFTTLGQRLLVKDDTQSPSGAFNGIYYVTQLQAALLGVILTRALDYDQPSDINNTGAIPVINGTVNGTTQWVETAKITTVGTDPLTFVKFARNPADYLLKANNLSDVSSASASFNNISPMTALGDTIYGGSAGAGTRLPGNTTSVKQFYTQTGTGSVSAAPAWAAIASADLPIITLTGDVTGSASGGSIATTIANNAVTNAKFRQSAGLSVVGNSSSTTANVADISGTANQVLVVNSAGTALSFGAVNLASSAAVTGTLSNANTTATSSVNASTIMSRDANSNVQINTINENFSTTATAAGLTTLTNASSPLQQFTGTTTQTVKLPNATTLTTGWQFQIFNRSTGTVTVQDGSASTLQVMAASSQAIFTCSSTGSSAGSWDVSYATISASNAITALTGDVVATGPGSVSSTIQSNVVSNSKLAQMASNTIKGNNTGSTANAVDLTVAQTLTMLGIRAGSSSLSSSATSIVVTLSTAYSSTSYAINAMMVNTTDTNPQFQPITITAQSTTGFTAKWNAPTDTANYSLQYITIGNN